MTGADWGGGGGGWVGGSVGVSLAATVLGKVGGAVCSTLVAVVNLAVVVVAGFSNCRAVVVGLSVSTWKYFN